MLVKMIENTDLGQQIQLMTSGGASKGGDSVMLVSFPFSASYRGDTALRVNEVIGIGCSF